MAEQNKKYKITITLLVLVFIFLFLNNEVQAESNLEFGSRILSYSDRGVDVAVLQAKLKTLSFYEGKIDGIYGKNTIKAVRKFQEKKGISVDGVTGPDTYSLLPQERLLSRMHISREEIILLARIIHGEARGENFTGKVAVGAVILNRVESKRFPDTIRGVILQKGQFSSLIDGQANLYPSHTAVEAAKAALIGYDPTFEALYFYNPEVATNLNWIQKRPITVSIGDHVFAR